MKHQKIAILAAILLAIAPDVLAQVPERNLTNETSLESLVGEVVSRNPVLKAAKLKWEAQKERPEIVKSLEDPMLTYGHFFRNVETRVGPMNQQVAVSQKFPFPGKRSLAESKAEKEALVAMWKFQALERELILRTKVAYYDLYLVEVSSKILTEELGILKSMLSAAKARYESGAGEQQEVLKVQLTSTDIERKLLDLEKRHETALARINTLRNAPQTTELKVKSSLEFEKLPTQDAAFRVATGYRQELISAGVEIERDAVDVALARKNWWPDFNVGVQYTEIGDSVFSRPPDDGLDAFMGFVSINIPVWWGKLKAQKREAEKRFEASQELKASIENEVLSEVRDTWYKARISADQLELYKTGLIPTAEQSFASARAGYQSSKVGFLDVLDSQRALLNLRLGQAMTESELGKSLAQLERSTGVDIETISALAAKAEPFRAIEKR